MSRLRPAFERLRAARQSGLVAYVTAGDPTPAASKEILMSLARAGADVIEVGVPFSDPIADGPTIQRASERALAAGSHIGIALDLVASLREHSDVPVVLFTYVNPVLRLGLDHFVDRAAAAGVDGVLLLDLPIEESAAAHHALDRRGLDQIFLISPTTTTLRLQRAASLGRGFLYAISRLGVTGSRPDVAETAKPLVDRIRGVTDLPVALGFGISTPEHVREVNTFADAAVVGSAIVQIIGEAAKTGANPAQAVERFVMWLKGAVA